MIVWAIIIVGVIVLALADTIGGIHE